MRSATLSEWTDRSPVCRVSFSVRVEMSELETDARTEMRVFSTFCAAQRSSLTPATIVCHEAVLIDAERQRQELVAFTTLDSFPHSKHFGSIINLNPGNCFPLTPLSLPFAD